MVFFRSRRVRPAIFPICLSIDFRIFPSGRAVTKGGEEGEKVGSIPKNKTKHKQSVKNPEERCIQSARHTESGPVRFFRRVYSSQAATAGGFLTSDTPCREPQNFPRLNPCQSRSRLKCGLFVTKASSAVLSSSLNVKCKLTFD